MITRCSCALLVLFACLSAFSQPGLPPAAGESVGKIWATIPFFRGANLSEFQTELSRTRAEARRALIASLGDQYIPLAMNEYDVRGLGLALSSIITDFDLLVRRHEGAVHDRVPLSLQELLKAHYDELFELHRIPPELQKARFYGQSTSPQDLVKEIRFLAYGTYSVMAGGRVKATLTLEEVLTGKSKSFLAEGPLDEAAQGLAQRLFDFFHSTRYPEWINPTPSLEWMAPLTPDQTVLATVARRYCQGQGARLPYAEELIQASLGGPYRKGSIVLQKNSYYVVADRQRFVDQYYYSTWPWANTQTGGPVHTSAGHGTIEARVWCVKGEPSKNIRLIESLYRLIRVSKDADVLGALEFILVDLQDFGMQTWRSGHYGSRTEAIEFLRTKDILVEAPTY